MILIQEYFESKDENRLNEIRNVLQHNIKNDNISAIYLLNEQNYPYIDNIMNSKLHSVINKERLTFKRAVEFANQFNNEIVIIANNDISFTLPNNIDNSLSFKNISSIIEDDPNNVITLTRWEIDKDQKLTEGWSAGQDAWIFRSPLVIDNINDIDFYFGKLGCDGNFGFVLNRSGFNIINCPKNIVTVHHHLSGIRTYTKNDKVMNFPNFTKESSNYKDLPEVYGIEKFTSNYNINHTCRIIVIIILIFVILFILIKWT